MDTNQPAINKNQPPVVDSPRPPFNEVSVLFPLLSLYTAGYMALMIVDFVLKGLFDLPDGIMPVYIALLGAYAADKEIRRWIGTPEPARKGSLFVYLWLLFFLAAYIIYSFRPEYGLPNNLLPVCLQVLGIFFGSRASKYIWESRGADDGRQTLLRPSALEGVATDDGGRQAKILDMIKAQGQVTNREVADALHVSAASAKRILADLVERGQIRLMGEGRGAFYVGMAEDGIKQTPNVQRRTSNAQ